jgi:hypothetical protein
LQSDVAGPFDERIPSDLEKKSELQGLSYKSRQEELTEKFHMSQDLLRQLNPNARFDHAGEQIMVANVEPMALHDIRDTVQAAPPRKRMDAGVATIVVEKASRASPLVGASLLFVSKGGGVVLSERVFISPESDRRSISASSKAPSTISRVSTKRSCREGPTALAPAGGKSWSRLIPTPSRTQTPLLVGCCARSRGPDLCAGVRAISSSHLPSHSLSERLSCFRRSIACAA